MQRNWNAFRQGIARSAILFRLLDGQLKDRDFLAAPHLTIGDIATGAQLYRYFELEIDRPKLPNVEAWYSRLSERPAYREHVMVPFDDLKGRLSF
jgi:glutathione S-transferase